MPLFFLNESHLYTFDWIALELEQTNLVRVLTTVEGT